jgi:hypothetical protein
MLIVTVPLRLGRGQNNREHHMARHRRVKAEREAVSWVLLGKPRPPLPCAWTTTGVLVRSSRCVMGLLRGLASMTAAPTS